jgi:hypothetical protein
LATKLYFLVKKLRFSEEMNISSLKGTHLATKLSFLAKKLRFGDEMLVSSPIVQNRRGNFVSSPNVNVRWRNISTPFLGLFRFWYRCVVLSQW